MKPNLYEIVFVMLILCIMYLYLKHTFFKPMIKVMEERERDIASGADTKGEAAAQIELRQAEYDARMKELRTQAFERRRSLSSEATLQKDHLIQEAQEKAQAQRKEARQALQAQREEAKTRLMVEVEALSESMVTHLLNQA
nr:ATP synthase F0 subunit B [uncultured Holophaga sp.]